MTLDRNPVLRRNWPSGDGWRRFVSGFLSCVIKSSPLFAAGDLLLWRTICIGPATLAYHRYPICARKAADPPSADEMPPATFRFGVA